MTSPEVLHAAASVEGHHAVAKVGVSSSERAAGHFEVSTLECAERLFREHGYVVIDDLFTAGQIERLGQYYLQNAANLLDGTNKPDKRPLFTVPVDGPFAETAVLDNSYVSPLLSRLLGDDYIVAALSAVASFPGAPDQFLHRDAAPLFGTTENEGDAHLPPYSVSMLVPLVDCTRETGCTRVWPGSHRIVGTESGLRVGSLDPELRAGSVLMTDGRVLHRGAANHSNRVRPLFYLTFHRSWYRDFGGYERRPPIDVSRAAFQRLPKTVQDRIRWFRGPYGARTMLRYRVGKRLPGVIRRRLMRDT